MRLEKEPGKISHLLDMQEKSLARLDYFISEIVTYSKNSRLNLKREAIDFRHEVNGIFADVNFMDGMNKIRKEVNVKQQEHFYSDIRRVRVILNNLITNAIKYRDQEKKDSFIKIDVVVNSEAAEIIIADNGIGIPSELHDKVFDMFFRGSETSKGSGLGLYIVAEVIKKIKGKISIVSSPKEGTTFKLMLPQFN
ncbi:MAG: HAMP domain-containing sensor histidine kinase [Bacteroidota bacterium]